MAQDDTTPSGKTGKVTLPIPPPPDADPTAILKKLQDYVESNKDAATGDKASWVKTVLVLAAVGIGIATWSIIDWWRSRQLAKLRFERDQARIQAQNQVMQQAVAENTSRVIDLRKQFAEIDKRMEATNANIRSLEAQQAADDAAIAAIRSWRDVARPPDGNG